MYVCIYVYPSQSTETPRLHNSPVFSAGGHDNKSLYLATVSHKTAQHSTLSLHTAFRLLLTSPIAPARVTRLLASPPYWLTSFAPRGREHFHCSFRWSAKHALWLAKQGPASLRSSKYVGVDSPAAIQCFIWLAIPSFCQPVKADWSSIFVQNVLALVELHSCTVLY